MDDSVEQRSAVVAEGRAAVSVNLELVARPVVLSGRERETASEVKPSACSRIVIVLYTIL